MPSPYLERFRRIANTVHSKSAYDSDYPKERAEQEYWKWRKKVSQLIDDLEGKQKGKGNS